jgi:hypothetical protein
MSSRLVWRAGYLAGMAAAACYAAFVSTLSYGAMRPCGISHGW